MWVLALWNSSNFFHQSFPHAHLSKFSPLKILCHTVSKLSWFKISRFKWFQSFQIRFQEGCTRFGNTWWPLVCVCIYILLFCLSYSICVVYRLSWLCFITAYYICSTFILYFCTDLYILYVHIRNTFLYLYSIGIFIMNHHSGS